MAGGYILAENHFLEDTTQVTTPQQLSEDSPCGAALTIPEPIPEEILEVTKE